MKSIQIICPVRNVTKQEKERIDAHVEMLREQGHKVHYPPEVEQNDPIGIDICLTHGNAMRDVQEVHIWWNSDSTGSLFDLGMAFMHWIQSGKSVKFEIINYCDVVRTENKSYQNVLRWLGCYASTDTSKLVPYGTCPDEIF